MQERKPISPLVAGLIIGAFMIIYFLALNFLGMEQNRMMGWIGYLLMIAGLIIFINMYGAARDHQVGFGGLFSYGFKATALIALLLTIFLIGFFLIFPEYKDKIIEAAREGMEKQGRATEEQIDQGMEMYSRNFMLFTVGGALFMYVLCGVIGSLLGAALTKKRPPNPFETQN